MALLQVDFFSDTLGMCVEMNVLLPERNISHAGVFSPQLPGPYPTLYLLHGMGGDHTKWIRRGLEEHISDLPLAVVMPAVQLSWYTDMDIGYKYETFISQELIQVCQDMFPLSARREDRFIAGESMGGYGAFRLALSAPQTYCAAASLSGALDAVGICQEYAATTPYPGLWRDIFGPPEQVEGSHRDLYYLAAHCAHPRPQLFQCCGTEDFLHTANTAFRDHLRGEGYDLTYSEGPGDHNWAYWNTAIRQVLAWLPMSNREEADAWR